MKPKSIGMKRTGSGGGVGKSKGVFRKGDIRIVRKGGVEFVVSGRNSSMKGGIFKAKVAKPGRVRLSATPGGRRQNTQFVICICNDGNEVSLELGKVYRVVRSLPNDPPGRIRILDEDNEDYLYLRDWFVPTEVPAALRNRVLKAVTHG